MGTIVGPECNGEMRRSRLRGLLAMAVGLAVASCGTDTPPGFDDPAPDMRQSMASALRQCTIDHGYSPDDAAQLGPYELGEGELAWRSCAYDALERLVEPNLREPEALDVLIEDDERLTEGIEAGTATRTERATVLQARLDNIRLHEQQLYREHVESLGAAGALSAATGDTQYQRVRSDIDAIARMF